MKTTDLTVLVVGGGGREHAIVKKLSESPRVSKLYCAPGNAGIASLAECLPIKATDIDGMVKAAKDISADLVFVAPDDPLTLGMVDRLTAEGIRAFGPVAKAAMLEEYITRREEALKRDHNKLGRELELFTTVDYIGQGLPIMLPKGDTWWDPFRTELWTLIRPLFYED